MERPATPLGYRADIDGLRAVAVLAVIGFHAFPGRVHGGFIGVDVFFVISGFLISGILFQQEGRGGISFRDFYARRVRRIFPALLVLFAACLIAGAFLLLPGEYAQLGKHVVAGAGFVSNLVSWSEAGYFDVAADEKPLLHLWSLGIEEQFYIVWPLLLWIGWKLRWRRVAFCGGVLGLSFAANLWITARSVSSGFYLPLPRFWELAAGALLAHWTFSGNLERLSPRARSVASLAGAALVLGAAFGFNSTLNFPGAWAAIPVLGAALWIGAGPGAVLNRAILARAPMIWIGRISYPLYLWHWPLLSFARLVESRQPLTPIRCAAVGAAVVLAWATAEWIERPLRSTTRGAAKVAGLSAAMVVATLAGVVIMHASGFPDRPSIRGLEDNDDELIRTRESDPACLAWLGEKTSFNYCRARIAGPETLVLIGDSHAHSAFPGVSEIAAARGLSTVSLANADCPPLLGAVHPGPDEDATRCDRKVHAMVDAVATRPDVRKIFIITRGPYYLIGRRLNGAPAEGPMTAFPDNGMPAAEAFTRGLQATVDRLRAAGKEVFYVIENPELSFDPAACVERPLRRNRTDCSQPLELVRERQADYRLALSRVHGLSAVIDPLSDFCPAGRCEVVLKGKVLYADSDHLSLRGSSLQAEGSLAPYLTP